MDENKLLILVDNTIKFIESNNDPYTIESILNGKYIEDNINSKQYTGDKDKKFLLPFQDEKTWNLIIETFKLKQPEITNINTNTEFSQYPSELQYLSSLFQKLSNDKAHLSQHLEKNKATKFIQWLRLIQKFNMKTAASMINAKNIDELYTNTVVKNNNDKTGQLLYNNFFNKTLPFIKQLILSMPKLFNSNNLDENKQNDTSNNELVYMTPNSNAIIELTRGQVSSLLACCWLGIPLYKECSFQRVLDYVPGQPAKLECFIRYFDIVRIKGINSEWFNKEKITIWRRCLLPQQLAILEHDNLLKNNSVLCCFTVYKNGCIEDQIGALHADFANKYIGGGVLGKGAVQEEIRFILNTECIISKLLCPQPMEHNESILIFGSQQFFNYKGYGRSFAYNGYRNNDKEIFFCENKKDRLGSCVIVGIDALHLYNAKRQVEINFMMREIVKSYVGYSISNNDIGHEMNIISTGNWGCGIFRGDPQLKSILQWISATLSGRDIAYYTFADKRVSKGKLLNFVKEISAKKITVAHMWGMLTNAKFAQLYNKDEPDSVFEILMNML
eukprot:211397_1